LKYIKELWLVWTWGCMGW